MVDERQKSRHSCEGCLPKDGYGEALDGCEEDNEGRLWVGNGEYGSQVAFCPYCGFKAKVMPSVDLSIFKEPYFLGDRTEGGRLAAFYESLGYAAVTV
jgi:hypothetical protein